MENVSLLVNMLPGPGYFVKNRDLGISFCIDVKGNENQAFNAPL
jgi:hypothetical protein